MNPKDAFNAAMSRAEHSLTLYEILHDTRQRGVRGDWAGSFKKHMKWPAKERIVRVDGKNQNSMLILRESLGIDREHFTHDFLSELLRSAIVAAVSALDRFMHDQVVKNSWKLLGRAEARIPKALLKVSLSPLVAKKALEKLRNDPTARPGTLVKAALQERLHRDHTFQNSSGVENAAHMLGLKDFWGEIANRLPGSASKGAVKAKLDAIARRRNQIVHEADLIPRTRQGGFKLRDIKFSEAKGWVTWMVEFVGVVDDEIKDKLG